MEDRRLILDLGSGEHGGFHLDTDGRIIHIDVQDRFRPEVIADAQLLPFEDSSVDAVLAMSILEHVPKPWLAVDEIYRVLRPGGLVVGYVPYMWQYHADETFH